MELRWASLLASMGSASSRERFILRARRTTKAPGLYNRFRSPPLDHGVFYQSLIWIGQVDGI